jgi:hypothetical protein
MTSHAYKSACEQCPLVKWNALMLRSSLTYNIHQLWDFNPKAGGSMFLRNVGIYQQISRRYNPEDQHWHELCYVLELLQQWTLLTARALHGLSSGLRSFTHQLYFWSTRCILSLKQIRRQNVQSLLQLCGKCVLLLWCSVHIYFLFVNTVCVIDSKLIPCNTVFLDKLTVA